MLRPKKLETKEKKETQEKSKYFEKLNLYTTSFMNIMSRKEISEKLHAFISEKFSILIFVFKSTEKKFFPKIEMN